MSRGDFRQRFLLESAGVRGEIVRLQDGLAKATDRTDYPPNVEALLCEAFVAANLLTATLKSVGRLTLQVRGPGDVYLLVVQVNGDGRYRGLARWHREPDAGAALASVFGDDARMTITLETGEGAAPYQGIVLLEGATLGDAIVRYFHDSEQLPTSLQVARDGASATGVLLQRLPASADATRRATSELSDEASGEAVGEESGEEGWRRVQALASTLEEQELAALAVPDLLRRLFHEEQVRLFEPTEVAFHCACTRERTDGMLLGLGRDEVDDIVAEQGAVTITCEFCDAVYRYDAVDVATLFVSGDSADAASDDARTTH